MLTPKDVDDALKERYMQIINSADVEKLRHAICVAAPTAFTIFEDDVSTKCETCGQPVKMRPWLKAIADKYKMHIVCTFCIARNNLEALRGQIVTDLAAIEQYATRNLKASLRMKDCR